MKFIDTFKMCYMVYFPIISKPVRPIFSFIYYCVLEFIFFLIGNRKFMFYR